MKARLEPKRVKGKTSYRPIQEELNDNPYFIDLNDDVLGNLGLYGLSFDHLDKGNVLLVSLCGRDLALHL